jgi:hypothetical protein
MKYNRLTKVLSIDSIVIEHEALFETRLLKQQFTVKEMCLVK